MPYLEESKRTVRAGDRAAGPVHPRKSIDITVKVRRKPRLPPLDGSRKAYLCLDQLESRYGASNADINAVSKAFVARGLELVKADPATRSVQFRASAHTMEDAFNTKLVRYEDGVDPDRTYHGRVRRVYIPDSLGKVVVGVFGLDNRRVTKLPSIASGSRPSRSGYLPAHLAERYRFPPGDGAGQSIGLLEFDGKFLPDDLATFCGRVAKLKAMPNVVEVRVNGVVPRDNEDTEEVMLDAEIVAGFCPKATIPIYFSTNTEKGWVDALDAAVHDRENRPSVLSISWGRVEEEWTTQAMRQINETLHEAAWLGITVCVSSGDDGSGDMERDGYLHVNFPASSPYVLAVGGTMLGQRREVVWNERGGLRENFGGSSGGGISMFFDRPKWQHRLSVEQENPDGIRGRCVPDVAAAAAMDTGYKLVIQGEKRVGRGGTSASAPLWAALIARINAKLGWRVGYLTPVLYQSPPGRRKSVGAIVCNDIRKGNNKTVPVGGYHARPGYDLTTGWGSPIGSRLLKAMKALGPSEVGGRARKTRGHTRSGSGSRTVQS